MSVWRSTPQGRRDLLREVDWQVETSEHWAVLGPNGAGKTTLVRIAAAHLRPSSGTARVLGQQLGRYPLARLRREIGVVDPLLSRRFDPRQEALEIVLTGIAGTVLLVDDVGEADVARAREALALVLAGGLANRTFGTCSEGERARILLARALLAEAPLLVLDEPAAGLDMPGRLLLLDALDKAIGRRPELATVTVTHELDTLPPRTTHALLLKQGTVVAAGPVEEALTARSIAECFELPLEIAQRVAVRS